MTSPSPVAARPFADGLSRVARSPFYLFFGALFVLLMLVCLLGPMLAPYDPDAIGAGGRFVPPSLTHWMGTDHLGRDVFSRFLSGARVSVGIGLLAALFSTVIGILIGALAGYIGGWVDDLLMRLTEMFMVIPRFFLALLLVALFGANFVNIVIAISLLTWPITARLVRAEFLALRNRQFVLRARMAGSGNLRIIIAEILPNCLGVIIVNATLLCAEAMLLEAGLSYLGLGDPTSGSWGLMLREAQDYLRSGWWLSAFPGIGIFLAVLIFNLAGDGINEALNPRSDEIDWTTE